MDKQLIIFSLIVTISAIAMYKYRNFLKTNKEFRFFFKEIFLPIFIVVFLIPGMIVRITYIPSGSMTPTLMKGDKVVLSKIHFGARTPSTIFQMPFFEKSYYKNIQLPSYRFPGVSSIKLGDPVVFNTPFEVDDNYDMRQWYVKRIVGMPGQRIRIKKGKIYINGERLQLPEHVELQYRYIVTLDGFRYASRELTYLTSSLDIPEAYPTDQDHMYVVHITEKKAAQLKQQKEVKKIEQYFIPLEKKKKEKRYFTYGKNFSVCLGGNVDNLPEITIPEKGMSIAITKENLCIYGHVILHQEGLEDVKIDAEKGTLTINGVQVDTYTFTQNYYAAKGDNRPDTKDFSYWGFLPESHIVGKPVLILFSNKNEYFLVDLFTLQMNWDRFFKVIR